MPTKPSKIRGITNHPIFPDHLLKDVPSREEILRAGKEPKPIHNPRLTQRYKGRLGKTPGEKKIFTRPGVIATMVAILKKAGKEGITFEEILLETHRHFPGKNRSKLATTLKYSVMYGNLPNGIKISITRKKDGRLIVDPKTIPEKIGKRPSAI